MRAPWWLAVGHALSVSAAVELLAQTGPPAAPTQTPGPAPTATPAPADKSRRFPVRVVLPSQEMSPAPGQTLPLNPVDLVQPPPAAEAKKGKKNELVVAPIPMSNPAIESGLALVGVYTIANRDPEDPSPPTTLGAGGFYTTNGSWAGGAGVKLYLDEDRFRATVGGAVGKLNYDLTTEDTSASGVPIKQEFQGGLGELMVGVGKRWYVGLRASYGRTQVSLREEGAVPVPPDQQDVTLVALGLKGERDSRDSVFYPTMGSRLSLLVNHNDTAFGSDFAYTKSTLTYADYIRLGEPVVLAVQGAGCYATKAAPFFDVCLFGSENVLRGYTVGRYLDEWTLAAQAEVRWRFANRWITTAFVGAGAVKPTYSLSEETDELPAGGIGIQWIAAPDNMITLRADYAVGEGGSRCFYLGIGQAF
jgi:hypothetical protein